MAITSDATPTEAFEMAGRRARAAGTSITVTGAAEARIPADQADLFASVSARNASRDAALQEANTAHAALTARAAELVASGAAARYDADPVSTYSNSWRDERGENVVEHQATASVRIVLTALEQVGEVSAQLTDSGADVRVQWELSAELRHEWTRRLRAEAVADARTAAADFAAAIGATAVELDALTDGRMGSASPLGEARMAMAAAPAPEVTVGQIAVTVRIEANFTAS